jgi:uncharacterized membrane protein
MTTIVILVATLVFRLLGALRVARFATWRISAAHGLAVMLVVTATVHFVPDGVTFMPTHTDLVAMMPPFVPFPSAMVYLTGVLELAGAAGLVLERTRRAAGICLALLLVVMMSANVNAALNDIPFGDYPASPLWERIPEQLLYVGVALWAAARPRARKVVTAAAS